MAMCLASVSIPCASAWAARRVSTLLSPGFQASALEDPVAMTVTSASIRSPLSSVTPPPSTAARLAASLHAAAARRVRTRSA